MKKARLHAYECTCACIHIHVCMCVCVVFVYMCVCVCVHVERYLFALCDEMLIVNAVLGMFACSYTESYQNLFLGRIWYVNVCVRCYIWCFLIVCARGWAVCVESTFLAHVYSCKKMLMRACTVMCALHESWWSANF